MASKSDFFVPANALLERRKEHLSPSGKYKLVVTPFTTKEGSWNYTQGLVFKVGDDTPLAEIQRNYSAFPFEWVEDHPNGHSYLVGGQDYQGQTVIELDTGKRADNLSTGAKEGHGFCWADYTFNREQQVLVVDGCHWACPYEFKFFDFSDPMAGWPEIETDQGVDADRRHPEFHPDGTITCFQSEYVEDDDDDEDDEDNPEPKKEPAVAATQTFKRGGLKLVCVNEWVSEKEQKVRADRKEAERKYDEWLTNFKNTDPLYLAMQEEIQNPAFTPEEYISIGITHKDWCPDFTLQERRMCRRIQKKTDTNPYTFDLEWGVDTGPVKLVVWKDGKSSENKFFMEHSVESIRAAFAYGKALIGVQHAR